MRALLEEWRDGVDSLAHVAMQHDARSRLRQVAREEAEVLERPGRDQPSEAISDRNTGNGRGRIADDTIAVTGIGDVDRCEPYPIV